MSEPAGIGHLLDTLGVKAILEQDEHLVEAIVIAKLAPFGTDDDTPRLIIAKSDGLDWIAQIGLFHAARAVIDEPGERADEDE